MAKGKKSFNLGGGGFLNEMSSGLCHAADSSGDTVRGVFIDRFGPPGTPTEFSSVSRSGGIAGKSPNLGKKFQGSKQR